MAPNFILLAIRLNVKYISINTNTNIIQFNEGKEKQNKKQKPSTGNGKINQFKTIKRVRTIPSHTHTHKNHTKKKIIINK